MSDELKGQPITKVSIGNVNNIHFRTPLWSNPKTDNFESLLNAIVNKRLVNLKMPGDSYILGSEAGMQLDPKYGGFDTSKIVYTSKFDFEYGKLRHAYVDDNGEYHASQVFLPARFRFNNGNIIRFINDDGTINKDYVKEENGRLVLDETKIDVRLLSQSSYRIPTSGHVSMSQIEIAGFLPIEAGDQMIINESLIAQKGVDFDVDKEYTYKLNTYVDKNGRIGIFEKDSISDMYDKYKG